MSRYLNKFLSIVPERQSCQILEILGKLKDKGAIKSIEEYSDKLQELTTTLKTTDPIPTFKYLQAIVGDEISSDIHNAMTETAAMDIETAFQEAQNIGNVLEMHKNMFRVTVLENLHKSIATLRSKLKLYQFLADSHDGFTYTQFNTFDNLDSSQTPRDALVNSLYFDYNKNEPVPENEDAKINEQAESLELANIGDQISITNIYTIDDDTTASVINMASLTQSMQNAIDNTKDTFWVYPIVLEERDSTGVTLKIRLDLGGVRRVNSISIDPAVKYPMILTKIAYLPQAATGSSPAAIVFSGATIIYLPMRFSFASINAQFIDLTFKQKSWEEIRYWVNIEDARENIGMAYTGVESPDPTIDSSPPTIDQPMIDDSLQPDSSSDLVADVAAQAVNDDQIFEDAAGVIGWQELATMEEDLMGNQPVVDIPIDVTIADEVADATATAAVQASIAAQAAAEAGAISEALLAAELAAAATLAAAVATAGEAAAAATLAAEAAADAAAATLALGATMEAKTAALAAEAAADAAAAATLAAGIDDTQMVDNITTMGSETTEQGIFGLF